MEDLYKQTVHISSCLREFSQQLGEFPGIISNTIDENKALKEQCMSLTDINLKLQSQIVDMNTELTKLKEENAAFSKVSHIIAMEKENSKLRQEISMLQKRIDIHQKTKTNMEVDIKITEESKTTEEEEETFVIKKIKGKKYYVSEKDNSIYNINDDDEVGDKTGQLVLSKGKYIAQWIN